MNVTRDIGCVKGLFFQVISLVVSTLATMREFGTSAGIKFTAEASVRVNTKVPKALLNTLRILQICFH